MTPSNDVQFSEALNHLQLAEEALIAADKRDAAKSVAELHEKLSTNWHERLTQAVLIATSQLDRCERQYAKVTSAINSWQISCPCMCDACTRLRNDMILDIEVPA